MVLAKSGKTTPLVKDNFDSYIMLHPFYTRRKHTLGDDNIHGLLRC